MNAPIGVAFSRSHAWLRTWGDRDAHVGRIEHGIGQPTLEVRIVAELLEQLGMIGEQFQNDPTSGPRRDAAHRTRAVDGNARSVRRRVRSG